MMATLARGLRMTGLMFAVVLVLSCGQPSDQTDKSSTHQLTTEESESGMKKVTGIGGIFFKAKDPNKLKDWYAKNLGLVTDEYGALFEFRSTDNPDQKGYLQWSPFTDSTKYFEPSQKEFMINYRVANLEELLKELAIQGVQIVGEMETYEYGKFAHIIDPEGNKIELWEPVDSVFTDSHKGKTTH